MACQVFLIRKTDEDVDPEDGMCWKRGDPVDVLFYDARFGESESPGLTDHFIVLTLTDVDREQAHPDLTAGYQEIDGPDGAEGVCLLRAYHIYLDELPGLLRAQMEATGMFEMSYAQARPYIRHRITGECW